MHRALLAGCLFAAMPAMAQDLELNIDATQAALFGIDTATIETELEAQAGEALNLVDPQSFMDSMANAAGIAGKGMGVDYASNPKKFSIGGGVGASTHSNGFSFARGETALPENGFATMLSLMGGVNLGLFDGGKDTALDRFMIYVNGMSLTLPSDREFGGSMYNIGGHLQVKLVKGPDAKIAEWGGIDLTTGFERSRYGLELTRDLPINAPADDVDLTWTAKGTYEVTSTVDSIPIELSTNVRAAVFTAYVGGGVDINTAGSQSTAELDGPVSASYRAQEENIGSAKLSVAFNGEGDPVVPRVFAGVQLNLLMVKVYGHLNAGVNGLVGGHVGGRVAM